MGLRRGGATRMMLIMGSRCLGQTGSSKGNQNGRENGRLHGRLSFADQSKKGDGRRRRCFRVMGEPSQQPSMVAGVDGDSSRRHFIGRSLPGLADRNIAPHQTAGRAGWLPMGAAQPNDHSRTARRRIALPITLTEDNAIAAAAMIGDSRIPKNGKSTPAATGTPSAL